jgi:hypothetical protein
MELGTWGSLLRDPRPFQKVIWGTQPGSCKEFTSKKKLQKPRPHGLEEAVIIFFPLVDSAEMCPLLADA